MEKLTGIDLREILHFLGWRGTPVEPALIAQLETLSRQAMDEVQPRVVLRRFVLGRDYRLEGTSLSLKGADIAGMLEPCGEVYLLAATLGAQSERLLLRRQAKSGAEAVLMDAVLSAAIEAVCDREEVQLRKKLHDEGLYLTDRFSPGYGDMPLEQTRGICEVLDCSRSIGLTVSSSGLMIPRKSVTAAMGVSRTPVSRRPSGCAGCEARHTCSMRRMDS